MAEWRCLTGEEQAMVRGLGYDPEPMMVNRVGEGHWLFLDMKTRDELVVSLDGAGRPKGTHIAADITPPRRRSA